jgi:hypothetical protein
LTAANDRGNKFAIEKIYPMKLVEAAVEVGRQFSLRAAGLVAGKLQMQNPARQL